MSSLLRNDLDVLPPLGTLARGEPIQVFAAPPGTPAKPQIARAMGIEMWDTAGNRYLDASSGPVACNLGYGNRRVLDALTSQAEAAAFANVSHFESKANRDFAERLAEAAGPGYERVFVVSGGSEANEAALKLARQIALSRGEASRWKVISRQPSYHGGTLGALAITGDPSAHAMFGPMLQEMPKVPAPVTYRIPDGLDEESWALKCAQDLEDRVVAEGPESVLAFIQEPVGGVSTGALVTPAAYMTRVREICDKYGILLIHDEVMSGGGRTGAFLSHDHWPDCRADLIVMAKGIGAGYLPLGLVLAPRDLVETVASGGGFLHGHTALGNPLSCAVGLAVLEETLERGLVERSAVLGAELKTRLWDMANRYPIIGDVRGKGLLMAVEFVADPATKRPFPIEAAVPAAVSRIAMQNGLILYTRRTNAGRDGDWVMVSPPLVTSDRELDEITDRLEKSLSQAEAEFSSLRKLGN
ncbi:aspartate aminotransferase family protein [Thalassobaculum salexigens]|uniref:aminotransferase family protein n=1 Tax=Thalassobaculum salexigens TaxID=455360 RepID=UPI00248F21E9|nr:aminotransferase class III-fold pyridoxal phosphate-dependent enzyme [Thalassobaculum salexigens]